MKSFENKKIIVVLGMHRSGTSVIARGLSTMGVELGDNHLPAKPDNEKGFWEDADINALNIELLTSLNRDWQSLENIGVDDYQYLDVNLYKLRAKELLSKKIKNAVFFGLKDPRISILLPFWNDIFKSLNLDVSYILAVRNPLSVTSSLAKRNGFDVQRSFYLWLKYTISSILQTEGFPRVVVDYDLFMDYTEGQLNRISDRLHLSFKGSLNEKSYFINHFIAKDLRHTKFSIRELEVNSAVPEEVVETYRLMSMLARDEVSIESKLIRDAFIKLDQNLSKLQPVFSYMDRQEKKVSKLNHQVSELNEAKNIISNLTQTLAELDGQISNLNQALAERDVQIANLNSSYNDALRTIEKIRGSTSWRITAPVRFLSITAKNIYWVMSLIPQIVRFTGGLRGCANKIYKVLLREGFSGIKKRILLIGNGQIGMQSTKIRLDLASEPVNRLDYHEWVRRYDTLSNLGRKKIKLKAAELSNTPLISILMPVYNPPIKYLENAIQSVRNQIYQNWELCIADDASTNPAVLDLLVRYSMLDSRIKVVACKENGHISRASNAALELVSGEFVALLDHDDLLAEHALYWVVDAINKHKDVGLIYSDEDKIDTLNRRYDPYFKCDLNYELLLAQNMVCHLAVFQTSILQKLGGFRTGFEGAQDYDLVLRVIEILKPIQVVHIPRVLYHWRALAGSTALAGSEKSYAAEACRKVVAEHLERKGISAEVKPDVDVPAFNRVHFTCPSPQPLVTIIIPTRDKADLLRMCLDSIIQKTTYSNYEVIIVDNGSVEVETFELFKQLPKELVRIVRDDSEFNYSGLNNSAAKMSRADLICMMNNDIEVLSPGWLEEMVSFAVQPRIGCVGARLWYPDGRLQHGGCILGLGGLCGHSHKYLPHGVPGYHGRATLHQSLSAVTGACLLIRRDIFEEVGGLDEQLAVAFNDVDFCLRVRDAGYRNVWTPYAEMNHHESASRGNDDTPSKQKRFSDEVNFMKLRWGESLLNDPAYSPNLTVDFEDFSYAWPPRVKPI